MQVQNTLPNHNSIQSYQTSVEIFQDKLTLGHIMCISNLKRDIKQSTFHPNHNMMKRN
jgi:hypothetical protein